VAKLSANGRTELYRFTKTLPHGVDGATRLETRALMSDRKILHKFSVGDMKFGWTVRGSLKKDANPESWASAMEKLGWVRQ
jgi:hypothetical protein